MDPFSEKQTKIERRRTEACARYPALWSRMIAEWNTPDPSDRVWLMYSANYLFRTKNIRWAIDPLTLRWRIKAAPKVDVADDLCDLSFVLLTHGHKDHLDVDLISALRHLPITWVIPEFILPQVLKEASLPREKIIVPSALKLIEFHGINILPLDGHHWERIADGSTRGVPAMSYLIECDMRRWLFPGDIRTYASKQFPIVGPLDIIFAHLWLGRCAALIDEPPLLDRFCRFFIDLNPPRLILTHLYELGRDASDVWDEVHAELVQARTRKMSANTQVTYALTGENILL